MLAAVGIGRSPMFPRPPTTRSEDDGLEPRQDVARLYRSYHEQFDSLYPG